jgi:hypothetical protein
MINYTCPVCAYSEMPYPVDEGNICPCCGTEFGFDDAMGVTHRQIRDRWVAAGTPWFSPIDEPPFAWDGVAQLLAADYEFDLPDRQRLSVPSETRGVSDLIGTLVDLELVLA